MSAGDLRLYIGQMLIELAKLADRHVDDEQLGRIAIELRLLAHRERQPSNC